MKKYFCNNRGFTLIEIIISLVVLALLSAMMVSYFGSSITESSQPILRMQNTMILQGVMENIRADLIKNDNLANLKAVVGSGNQNNIYGVYTVVFNDYIKFNTASYIAEADTAGSTGNDGIDILKISIKDSSGFTLTSLFVN